MGPLAPVTFDATGEAAVLVDALPTAPTGLFQTLLAGLACPTGRVTMDDVRLPPQPDLVPTRPLAATVEERTAVGPPVLYAARPIAGEGATKARPLVASPVPTTFADEVRAAGLHATVAVPVRTTSTGAVGRLPILAVARRAAVVQALPAVVGPNPTTIGTAEGAVATVPTARTLGALMAVPVDGAAMLPMAFLVPVTATV